VLADKFIKVKVSNDSPDVNTGILLEEITCALLLMRHVAVI